MNLNIKVTNSPMRNGDNPSNPLRVVKVNGVTIAMTRTELFMAGLTMIYKSFFPTKYNSGIDGQ